MAMLKHNLVLTPGRFINGKQEPPWICQRCNKTFKRYTRALTCKVECTCHTRRGCELHDHND